MPRQTQSKLGAVLAFFRKASMDLAEEGIALAREVVAERRQTAQKIREGQRKPSVPAAPPAAAARVPDNKKKAVAASKKKAAPVAATRKRVRKSRTQVKAAPAPVERALTDAELDEVDQEMGGAQLD